MPSFTGPLLSEPTPQSGPIAALSSEADSFSNNAENEYRKNLCEDGLLNEVLGIQVLCTVKTRNLQRPSEIQNV